MGRQEQAMKHLQDAIKHFENAKETDIVAESYIQLLQVFESIQI